MKSRNPYSILFVCLGNICRSPLAEGVFRHLTVENDLEDYFLVDSCGTGHWHIGEPPHPETKKIARENGISLSGMKARQIDERDFSRFDLLVAMDRTNLSDLRRMRGGKRANIICLREYDSVGSDLNVPDPYYGGPGGFQEVYEIVERCCEALLEELIEEQIANG